MTDDVVTLLQYSFLVSSLFSLDLLSTGSSLSLRKRLAATQRQETLECKWNSEADSDFRQNNGWRHKSLRNQVELIASIWWQELANKHILHHFISPSVTPSFRLVLTIPLDWIREANPLIPHFFLTIPHIHFLFLWALFALDLFSVLHGMFYLFKDWE